MPKKSKIAVRYPMKQKLLAILFVVLFAGIGTCLLVNSRAASYPHNNFNAPPPGRDAVIPDFAGANWVDHSTGETFTQTAYIAYNLERGSARQINLYFSYNPSLVKLLDVRCVTSWGCKKSKWNSSIAGTHQGTGFVVCVDAPSGRYKDKLIYTMSMRALRNLNGGGGNGYAPDAWFVGLAGIAPGSCNSNPTGRNTQWSWLQGRCGVISGTVYPDCHNGTSPDTPTFNGFSPLSSPGRRNNNPTTNNVPAPSSGGGSNGGSSANTQGNNPKHIPNSSKQGNAKQPKLEPSPFYDGKEYKLGSDSDTTFGGLFAKEGGSSRIVTGVRWAVASLLIIVIGIGGYWWWHVRIKKT